MDTKQLSDKLLTKLRELSEKLDGWGEIRMIGPADARAILAAFAPSDAAGAPIYQVSFSDDDGWLDTNEQVYNSHPEHARRIVYAAPVAPAAPTIASWSWLRGVIEDIPVRREPVCGQPVSYVQRSSVLNWLDYCEHQASAESAAPAAVAPISLWQTGVPPVKDGKSKEFILAVRRGKAEKVFVFAATYANNYTDDGCLEDSDGTDFVANGWFLNGLDMSGEFNEVFEPISLNEAEGDAIVGWQELPKWDGAPTPTVSADAAAPTCMCSGLGPCEQRTDGLCRLKMAAQPDERAAVPQADATPTDEQVEKAVDAWFAYELDSGFDANDFNARMRRALLATHPIEHRMSDAEDAERYRYLRDAEKRERDGEVFAMVYIHAPGTIPYQQVAAGSWLDALIDAALQSRSHSEGDQP